MESELGFDDFFNGSEFEDAEGACQNVEMFSFSSSDMKSLETGTLNSSDPKSDFENSLLIVLNAGLLERFSETITQFDTWQE